MAFLFLMALAMGVVAAFTRILRSRRPAASQVLWSVLTVSMAALLLAGFVFVMALGVTIGRRD